MFPLLAVAGLLLAADAPKDAANKELDRLQGTWVMESLEIDGKTVPADKIKDATLTIKGDRYITKTGGKEYVARIARIDPSKKPKEIDMSFPSGPEGDKVAAGIYELDGDRLKLVRAQAAGQPRPTDFGTWPNTAC